MTDKDAVNTELRELIRGAMQPRGSACDTACVEEQAGNELRELLRRAVAMRDADNEIVVAEARLREKLDNLRATCEATQPGILVMDRDYNCVYANEPAIEHAETTRDKVVGKNMRNSLSHVPHVLNTWIQRIDQVSQTGIALRVEDAIPIGDRYVHGEAYVAPMKSADGDVYAVGLVFWDLSRFMEVEVEFEEERRRFLEMAMKRTPGLDAVGEQMQRQFGIQR